MRADNAVNPAVKFIDDQITTKRTELAKLEQARQLLTSSEPVVAKMQTATRGKRGRKRRFQASATETPVKRGRGRPKGSKNKPKPQPQNTTTQAPAPQQEEFAQTIESK